MVDHWLARQRLDADAEALLEETVAKLQPLVQRLEEAIRCECARSPAGLAFVKLSTRSPKDSHWAFSQGEAAYRRRLASRADLPDHNERWRILSEEVGRAGAVSSGAAGVRLLCDSGRIYEDLEYALRPPRNASGEVCKWNVQVVARSWDPRITAASEFRGIVWGFKLTCLGQYFHPVHFPELKAQAAQIEEDCHRCFEAVVRPTLDALGGRCIVDFAWLGIGEVRIIELNPFDGDTLGTFGASTGLFSWEDARDRQVMEGQLPFELRIREAPLSSEALAQLSDPRSRAVLFPEAPVAGG